MYWTNLWQSTVHVQQNIFEKLVNHSRHSESLKNVGKWLNRCFRRKMPSISISSESLKSYCAVPRISDHFGRKRYQKSVNMWATNFYYSFFKNILSCMSGGLSKIRSVHTYVLKGFILVVSTVCLSHTLNSFKGFSVQMNDVMNEKKMVDAIWYF